MLDPRSLVNSISLSRIVIAFFFVLCFQKQSSLLWFAIALSLTALATDLLDGYFARRLRVASIHGRHWDSLGDKAFYIATIIAFNTQGFLGPLISWALIFREVALYITRILFIEKLPKIGKIWPLTKLHGYCMYGTIVLGLFRMYTEVYGSSFDVYPYMQITAYASLVFGIGSMIQFLRLQ